MTLEYVNICVACGKDKFKLIHENLNDTLCNSSNKTWKIYKCINCLSIFLNPRYDKHSIYEAYNEYHTHGNDDQNKNKKSSIALLKRSISNSYRNKKYGTLYEPNFPFGYLVISILGRYKDQINSEFRCIKLNQNKIKKKVLDVGFGGGNFLKIANDLGWQSFGVDTDPVTVKNAKKRGHRVELGGIEKFSIFEQYFDCITISHVIEHVHNPNEVLNIAFSILKPGGTLWIETPNSEAIGHKFFGRDWRGLEPPRHLTIFSWCGLEKALLTSGFEQLEKKPRIYLYKPMAKASLKVSESMLINIYKKIRIIVESPIVSLLSLLRSEYCEFITIEAVKPNIQSRVSEDKN